MQIPIPPPNGQDAAFVKQAFEAIAPRYVITNHVLSLGIDVLWRKRVAQRVRDLQPRLVLDVATGSGDLAAEIQARCPEARVLGSDFSISMLGEARRRGLRNLILGDAMALPLADNSVDVVTVGFGLRNMASWAEAAREMGRVLRPGGSLLVLDFSLPGWGWFRGPYLFYLRKVMPKIAGLLTGQRAAYEYLCGSIERFPSGEAMGELLRSAGFRKASAEPLSFGIASLYTAEK